MEFDEMVPQTMWNGHLRAAFKYGPDEFRGHIWQMMYATFWREGWGIGVTVAYRDGDPRNLSMFNLTFTDSDGTPLIYRLDEQSGIWHRKRRNARSVKIVETGEVFDSVKELATHLNGSTNIIYMCLRGVQQTHKGYHFEWAE